MVEDDEPSTDGSRERDYDIGRLMAFSDGVFAVAITLLVFNVPVPAIAQSDAMSRLPNALLQTAPALLTFALSFFLVGFYWIRHHQLFRQVVSADVWLLWLNLIVLFLVCLLPFSAGENAKRDRRQVERIDLGSNHRVVVPAHNVTSPSSRPALLGRQTATTSKCTGRRRHS